MAPIGRRPNGSIQQGRRQGRQVRHATSQAGHAEEWKREARDEPEAGHRDRPVRSPREGRNGSEKIEVIGPHEAGRSAGLPSRPIIWRSPMVSTLVRAALGVFCGHTSAGYSLRHTLTADRRLVEYAEKPQNDQQARRYAEQPKNDPLSHGSHLFLNTTSQTSCRKPA